MAKKYEYIEDRYVAYVVNVEGELASPFLHDLEATDKGLYCAIVRQWMNIAAQTPGTKPNRAALGHAFSVLQKLYSQKSIGGNRRLSGRGVFEKECEARGYPPRTVRGWIADYEAILNGTFTEAQKRAERTKGKTTKTPTVDEILVDLERLDAAGLEKIRAKVDQLLAARQWTTPQIIETKEGLVIQ